MTSRAGRHLAYFGFAALIGVGLQTPPAAAQDYLADNGSGSVTVDYSVLGGGGGGVTRSSLPGSPLAGATCSCASAPMGVIAAAPRPTFNNPFNTNLAMQAPAVPPGFMTYAQVTGAPSYSGSGNAVVVLHPPAGGNAPQMAEMPSAAPAEASPVPAPLPATTETANGAGAAPAAPAAPTETQTAALPKTTPTQSQPSASQPSGSEGAIPPAGSPETGAAIPPAQPDNMPTNVPSPVGPGETVGNVSQPPAAAAPEQTPSAPAPESATAPAAPEAQNATPPAQPSTEQPAQAPAEQPAQPSTEQPAQPPAEQPAQPSTEQQAAVAPSAPANNATPPAAPENGNAAPSGGATLPAGSYRVLYTGESDDVPANANGDLDKVAAAMQSDQNMRIQVLAYAAGTEDTESKARRKSLARGLAIRSYLIKAGVPSTRIDVRALGSKADGGPADRVDIVPAS
jgi:outer membrane protein OmpA-like peptidoglycan-associated protein